MDSEHINDSFDKNALLEAYDHDMDFLNEVVGMFIEDYPRLMKVISDSISLKDWPTVSTNAHTIKGMVSNFNADTTTSAAFHLEKTAAGNEPVKNINEAYLNLKKELLNMEAALLDLVKEDTP